MTAQSKANCMYLEQIPDELKDLNNLELHTICKRILFMKLVKLPRGKQKGMKGAAVNVPADLGPACQLLPRIPSDAHIISLTLIPPTATIVLSQCLHRIGTKSFSCVSKQS